MVFWVGNGLEFGLYLSICHCLWRECLWSLIIALRFVVRAATSEQRRLLSNVRGILGPITSPTLFRIATMLPSILQATMILPVSLAPKSSALANLYCLNQGRSHSCQLQDRAQGLARSPPQTLVVRISGVFLASMVVRSLYRHLPRQVIGLECAQNMCARHQQSRPGLEVLSRVLHHCPYVSLPGGLGAPDNH